jgi:hypothetical protein
MTNNQKILLGLSVVAIAYYLWNKKSKSKSTTEVKPTNEDESKKTKSTLSQNEKVDLFLKALTKYEGGTAPSPELLKRLEQTKNEARKKIQDLGLQGEFETYVKNLPKRNPNEALQP